MTSSTRGSLNIRDVIFTFRDENGSTGEAVQFALTCITKLEDKQDTTPHVLLRIQSERSQGAGSRQ